jgi:hypothetical protein
VRYKKVMRRDICWILLIPSRSRRDFQNFDLVSPLNPDFIPSSPHKFRCVVSVKLRCRVNNDIRELDEGACGRDSESMSSRRLEPNLAGFLPTVAAERNCAEDKRTVGDPGVNMHATVVLIDFGFVLLVYGWNVLVVGWLNVLTALE